MAEAEQFAERVIRIEPSQRHFTLLATVSGDYLGLGDDRMPTTMTCVDDRAIWEAGAGDAYRHVMTGELLEAPEGATPSHGPERLPSEYLAHLREHGWVCLTSVLAPETVDGLQQVACTDAYAERKHGHRD